MGAQLLDAGRVPQVDAVDVYPVAPLGEAVLGLVAPRGVLGEARGADDGAARAQQQDRGLEADLEPGAGEQRHAAGEVRLGVALAVVEVPTGDAQLVVEVVHLGVGGAAGVAGALFNVAHGL